MFDINKKLPALPASMRPEHFDLSSSLFLPVAGETCASLLGADGAKLLTTLTDPELAAILVIQNLGVATEEQLTLHWTETVLARLISWAIEARKSETSGLLPEAQRLFEPIKFYDGCKVANRLDLQFLLPNEVSEQNYLLPDGKWDVTFKARHHRKKNPFSEQVVTAWHRERWLTPAQDKLIRVFRANFDEHLHIQGYAGIGKSHLIGALSEYLDPRCTLVLAHTKGKLEALRNRMGGAHAKAGSTFLDFAQSLLPKHRPQVGSTSTRSPSKLALLQELNILGLSKHDELATLNICLKVIERYCKSRDASISSKHLPNFQSPLPDLDARVLLQYSSRLWMYLEANSNWDKQIGLETLLAIKRANLAGCELPKRYSHVLIDESQDLPDSLLQIIERGRQVLITLGDEYQQAGGAMVNRKRDVRQSDISYSVRSGRNVENLVNPLIYRHSKKGKTPFEGASETDVIIKYYPRNFLPSDGCVVLTASYWDTMKWVIEMNTAEPPRSLILRNSEALKDFKQFMTTAIALFRPDFYSVDHIGGPHLFFSEMSGWQQVREANKYDGAFLWVENKLEEGFNISDMNQLIGRLAPQDKSCTVIMAKEAGGMEFDRVLLTHELLTSEKFKNKDEFDERICAVYIAISRAKRQLYLPYNVVEWVEFHNHQKFRELTGY